MPCQEFAEGLKRGLHRSVFSAVSGVCRGSEERVT